MDTERNKLIMDVFVGNTSPDFYISDFGSNKDGRRWAGGETVFCSFTFELKQLTNQLEQMEWSHPSIHRQIRSSRAKNITIILCNIVKT